MSKRRRVDAEEETMCGDQIDRISMLPDELLVCILSLLTFKEATATSILSSRWRYLWTFTPKLDFDGLEFLHKVEKGESLLDEERRKYIGWVNHVTKSHKASTIEEFRLYFYLNKTHKTYIDQWLTYALARKVQRLELNMTHTGDYLARRHECYSFPDDLLRTEKQIFSLCSGSRSLRQCDSIDLSCLKSIIMFAVNVNDEALEFFLRNCPLLEHLSVARSSELSSLRVIGPLSSIKHLEIRQCINLVEVEIRDVNLVYLKYWGPRIHFLLENVPKLVELYLGGNLACSMKDVLSLFSSCLPQLEILTIDRFATLHREEAEEFYSAVEMRNLKQLIIKVLLNSKSLRALTNLIRASPCLQRFVVEPMHIRETAQRKLKQIDRTYNCLKEVEFSGYRGLICDLELIIHFLENAVGLEKIIIHPYKTMEEEARTRAREQLMPKVPPRINLEIL